MKEVCREQVERTIQNLKKNQMEAVFFPTGKELLAALDTYVKDGAAVSFGGSMTLFETGVMEWLLSLIHIYPNYYTWDRVHPSRVGHMVLAKCVMEALGFAWLKD